MPTFEIDKWPIRNLTDYHRRGRLNLKPPYQRGRAWSDEMRFALIDTVLSDYPMGVILLSELETEPAAKWETVDGQQRCTTLVEYVDGKSDWTNATPPAELKYSRFDALDQETQDKVLDYQIPVARLRRYSVEQIRDIFVRIQYGRALSVGEKVKAINSAHGAYIAQAAEHKVFHEWGAKLERRESHWALATAFYQAAYKHKPLERQEYRLLEKFLRDKSAFAERDASKAIGDLKWVLNYAHSVLKEAIALDHGFRREIASQRLFKWFIPALMILRPNFALSGKEPDVARGLQTYWRAKDTPGTDEYDAYFLTLRSGRIDTDEVRACLEQLMNSLVAQASLVPVDRKRFFDPLQRNEIFKRAHGKCEGQLVSGSTCGATLSVTNYHADHRVPHVDGGPTEVSNAQALCSGCNRRKGRRSALSSVFMSRSD